MKIEPYDSNIKLIRERIRRLKAKNQTGEIIAKIKSYNFHLDQWKRYKATEIKEIENQAVCEKRLALISSKEFWTDVIANKLWDIIGENKNSKYWDKKAKYIVDDGLMKYINELKNGN